MGKEAGEMKVDLNKQHLIALISKEMPFAMAQRGHYERQGMLKFTGDQWNEKWEWNYDYLVKVPELGLIALYNSLCKVENRLIVLSVGNDEDQLRQQLAAEQAKSAELEKQRNFVTKSRNKAIEFQEQYLKEIESAEATIAAMRLALEVARRDLVTSHNLLATDSPDMVLLNNTITGFHGIKPMTALSGNKIVWMTDNSAGIGAIDQALSNTAGAEYAERVKYLEKVEVAAQKVKAGRMWCDHGMEKAAIVELLDVLGEGKADA